MSWPWMPPPLPQEFYENEVDPIRAARSLLGKIVWTQSETGVLCGAQVVEVEGYDVNDQSCHAFKYRRTQRNQVMFERGGVAYVFKCYGVFHLFNIVFGPEGEPTAVLIRACAPLFNVAAMAERRGLSAFDRRRVLRGPGLLSRAMGISCEQNYGQPLFTVGRLWLTEPLTETQLALLKETAGDALEPPGDWQTRETLHKWTVKESPRIGVSGAGRDASLLWRFFYQGHRAVSTGPMIWSLENETPNKKRNKRKMNETPKRSSKSRETSENKSISGETPTSGKTIEEETPTLEETSPFPRTTEDRPISEETTEEPPRYLKERADESSLTSG